MKAICVYWNWSSDDPKIELVDLPNDKDPQEVAIEAFERWNYSLDEDAPVEEIEVTMDDRIDYENYDEDEIGSFEVDSGAVEKLRKIEWPEFLFDMNGGGIEIAVAKMAVFKAFKIEEVD